MFVDGFHCLGLLCICGFCGTMRGNDFLRGVMLDG